MWYVVGRWLRGRAMKSKNMRESDLKGIKRLTNEIVFNPFQLPPGSLQRSLQNQLTFAESHCLQIKALSKICFLPERNKLQKLPSRHEANIERNHPGRPTEIIPDNCEPEFDHNSRDSPNDKGAHTANEHSDGRREHRMSINSVESTCRLALRRI